MGVSDICWVTPDGSANSFPDVQVFFSDTITSWQPKAYMYHVNATGHWCYGFLDDGEGANTTLGATWWMHQDVVIDLYKGRVGIAPRECPEIRQRPPVPTHAYPTEKLDSMIVLYS